MKPEWKKLLVLNLPYLLFVYLFAKCGQAYRLAAGADASAKLLHLTSGISAAFANPLPSLHPFDLCVGVTGAVAVRLIVYSKGKNAKKYRKGEEYGSARWGTAKDIAPYIDPKFENNILLTQTERLTMTGRPKDPKTARNKNVLVIGGSGSGKTRFYVKPNLMQCFPTSDYQHAMAELRNIVEGISKLRDTAYAHYSLLVEQVLKDQITDEQQLEQIMDGLCDFCDEIRFIDLYDYIDWWLYEATDDYTVWEADCTMKYCLKEPEALYDYITGTLKPVPVSSGESTSQQE